MSQITLLGEVIDKGTPKGSNWLCTSFKMDISADIYKKQKRDHKAAYRNSHLQK